MDVEFGRDRARFDLHGRVAIVSGAASGMGRASAVALAEHGADLLLADLNAEGLSRTAETIGRLGRRAETVAGDVSDPVSIRTLFERLDRDYGRVDFLGNIAGEGILGRPEEITAEQVHRVFQNLVFGRFLMCQEGQEWQAPMAADVLEACAKLCWQGEEQVVARDAG